MMNDGVQNRAVEQFREAMAANGIFCSDPIIEDGKIHRFHVDGDEKGSRNGWYCFYGDGIPAGSYGSWKLEIKSKWCSKQLHELTPQERAEHRKRVEAMRHAREAEEARAHEEAAKLAQEIWRQAKPADSHPYLTTKQVKAYGIGEDRGRLVLPVQDVDGNIHSLQFIQPDGKKKFLHRGAISGHFCTIGDESNRIWIAEGYATGAAIHQVTGDRVVVAFNAGNIRSVAEVVRSQHPQAHIIFAADNDQWTDGNPGLTNAQDAAHAVGGAVIFPEFSNLESKPTDWNDLLVLEGMEVVLEQIRQNPDKANSGLLHSGGPGGPSGPSPMSEQENSVDHQKNGCGPGGPDQHKQESWPMVSGYVVDDKGVSESPSDPNKSPIPITFKPCAVMAHCRDEQGENWGAFVRWEDRDGVVHECAVPLGRLHEQGATLINELADCGLPIVPGAEKKLLKYLASSNIKKRLTAATQTGWQSNDSAFVLPQHTIAHGNLTEAVVYQTKSVTSVGRSVQAAGTLEEWQTHVANPVDGNPILQYEVSAAFAAPLLHLTGTEGGGSHLYGTTSMGKTTALQVSASVWGNGADPTSGHGSAYVAKWNLTKNATEGLAEAHNDLPLCLDEIGEVDTKEFGRMIYQLAGGAGKGRMRADTTLKQNKVWRTFILSTGEVSVSGVIEEEGKRMRGGQAVRLLDIPATHPLTNEGIISHTPNGLTPAPFIDQVKKACAQFYGTAGPAFLQKLFDEGLDEVRNDLRQALEETSAALTPPTSPPEVARAIKRIALVAVAGEKAINLGVLPWRKGLALSAAKEIVDRYLAVRGQLGGEAEQTIEDVRAFILAYGGSRFARLDGGDEKTIIKLAGYRDETDNIFYFTKAALKEACPGYQPHDVARTLHPYGWLHKPDKEHFTVRVSIPGGKRTRLYGVFATILDTDINEESFD